MFDVDEPKTKGLGRGLNALFEDAEIEVPTSAPAAAAAKVEAEITATPGRKRQTLGIEQLAPSPFQPRRLFNNDTIDELASSIKEYGVLQPLLVRENPKEPGQFEIIAGERRWRAAQAAQLHELPVIILEMSELEAFKIALIENLQREDLDPIDEALGYQRLLTEYGQSKEQLAKIIGKSRPHISNMLRLLSLPVTVQSYITSGTISMGHARALITAKDPAALAEEVISKGLSVRQTEKFAAEAQGREQRKSPRAANDTASRETETSSSAPAVPKAMKKDADTLALENDMTNALGMRVTIDSADGRSGTLSIEFRSLDQLDEVLHRLAHFPGSRLSG